MIGLKLDKDFFSEPPDLKKILFSVRQEFQTDNLIYSIKSLYTLNELLDEKRLKREHPVLRYLIDANGVMWFARETRQGIDAPKHFQMTGLPLEQAHCLAAGNLKFRNSRCKTLKNINHKSGDFQPDFQTLRIVLVILVLNESILPFKLPTILSVKELDDNGDTCKKHLWPMRKIRAWVKNIIRNNEKLQESLIQPRLSNKEVCYLSANTTEPQQNFITENSRSIS